VTELKRHFPDNRLAKALSAAPPRTVAQCLAAADTNVASIAGSCRDQVMDAIGQLESLMKAWPAEPDEGFLMNVYTAGLKIVGVATAGGLPLVDRAIGSLLDVVDGQLTHSSPVKEPIEVHVATAKMLAQTGMGEAPAEQLLAGLAKVRDKHRAAR
jgi:hypothetical protein